MVNSTNSGLNLSIGRLSAQIVETAGHVVQEECEKKYSKGIGYGQVAVTTAGKMKAKALYHGILGQWDQGHGYAETVRLRPVV